MAYKIQYGDTLSAIAKRNKTTVADLMSLNPQIKNPNLIMAGQNLNLPQIKQQTIPALPKLPITPKPQIQPIRQQPVQPQIQQPQIQQLQIPSLAQQKVASSLTWEEKWKRDTGREWEDEGMRRDREAREYEAMTPEQKLEWAEQKLLEPVPGSYAYPDDVLVNPYWQEKVDELREAKKQEQQQKDKYNTFGLQKTSPLDVQKTSLSFATPMSDTAISQTQVKLDKITQDYLTETGTTADNAWLSPESKTIKAKQLQGSYTKKATDELRKLIQYSPDAINKFIPQLQQMAKAGFKMTDIQKTIKDLSTGALEPVKPQLESYYERYMKPEVVAQYQQPLEQYKTQLYPQIQQLQALPQEMRDLFYGTPEKQGQLAQLKQEAETQKQQINAQIASRKTSLAESSDLAISQLNNDLNSQKADIALKGQRAKDYLTGQLAKMGALNTTGASANAISELNADYDRMGVETQQNYNNALSQNKMKYNDLLNDLIDRRDAAIANIDAQVNKSEGTKNKEISDLEIKIFDKVGDLNMKLLDKNMEVNKTALIEAKKQSAEFVKNYFNIVSGGTQQQLLNQVMPKILNFQQEQQNLKVLKDNLALQIKRKQLTGKATKAKVGRTIAGKTQPIATTQITDEIRTLANAYVRGESLGSIGSSKKALVLQEAERIKVTPSLGWLESKGYETEMTYTPTSKAVKEWQSELKGETIQEVRDFSDEEINDLIKDDRSQGKNYEEVLSAIENYPIIKNKDRARTLASEIYKEQKNNSWTNTISNFLFK